MPFSRIGSISAGSTTSNGVTTGTLDTTGATLLVLVLSDYQLVALSAITDSKGNTWTQLTSHFVASATRVTLFYCLNPVVGTGHTFTATRTGGFMSIAVGAYAGPSPAFDQQSGATANASTLAPGSLTPAQANELVLVGSIAGSSAITVLSIDSGLTIRENHALNASGGTEYAVMLADLIETAIVAKNPTVTFQGTGNVGVAMALFTTTAVVGPAITLLSPTTGHAGNPVTILGTNFGATQGAGTVKFNGTTAIVVAWSDTSIIALVPTSATTGNVVVNVGGLNSNGMSFTVTAAPAPTAVSGMRPNTFNSMDSIGQVQTCDFEIEDRHGSSNYLVHQAVSVLENTVTIFQGDIDESEVRPFESPYDVNDAGVHTLSPVGARVFSIHAQGPNALANRLLTGAFSAQARVNVSLVVSTLASKLGIPLSIATSPSSLLLSNSFLSDQETLSDAFTRLADIATALSGVTHIWKIAWDGTGAVFFQFQPITNLVSSSSIGAGGYTIRANTLRIRTTREQFSNSVVLKLDRYLKDGGDRQVDTFNGSDVFFGTLKCQAPLAGQPTIMVNGTDETVGIKDVDTAKDWYWAVGSSIVTVGDTGAGGSDTIVVTYVAHDLRSVTMSNFASIGSVGLFQVPLQSPDSGNVSSPIEYASSELQRRSGLTIHVTCQVLCPPGVFQAGYLVPAVFSGMGILGTGALSGYFLCRSVRTFDEDLTVFWRELDLIQGPQLYRASQFMRRLGR